ncbi:MAG TPA: twin-arginine translocation signal domain-containing protein [Chloroflexota bacterium]|nr:twin-arginine translocation signal domain-containing protein [Chloroflexota bacterium]
MHADRSDQDNASLPPEPTEVSAPAEEAPADPLAEAPRERGWHRRTFLKAAALGTAAAALLNGDSLGINFGPIAALANDLSDSPCTAEDVEIVGPGIVINEPCACTPGGTFNAQVQFTVRNNTSTGRYCITLHLVPDGTVLTQSTDLILRDASGSSTAPGKSGGEKFHDTVMFATIANFPCSVGQVCFGQAGVIRGKCAPGTCSTVAWNTSPNAANCTTADQNPPGGQCRHQQICIIGFGATLTCVANCSPGCGGTATLRASVTGGTPPYTFTVAGSDGSSQSFGPTTETSHDFDVVVTQNTTYTLTVTDSTGCQRTASTSLQASPITVALSVSGSDNCSGQLTFTATVTGGGGTPSFTFKVDGVAKQSGSSNTFSYGPVLDGACHTVSVDASSGGCNGSASTTVSQCVTTTLSCA